MTFQLGGQLLDACVLAVLLKEDTYGYILTQSVKTVIDISESTLYPVLRRLQKDGYLVTYDRPFQGRNRRYYSITSSGRAIIQSYIQDWKGFKNNVDQLLGGGKADEQE